MPSPADDLINKFLVPLNEPGMEVRPDQTSIPPSPDVSFEDLLPEPPRPNRGALNSLVRTNPPKIAEQQKIANDLGMPRAVVEGAPDDAKALKRTNEIENILKGTVPITREMMADPSFAEIAHPDVERLSSIEQLSRSLRRGALTRELGVAGHRLRRTRSPEAEQQVKTIQEELDKLGQAPTEGFISWLSSASEILGQQLSSFGSPEASARVFAGGTIGAGAGLGGGPFAPITTAVGTAAGIASGLTAHFIADSFEVEGGLAYLEMKRQGIDEDVASWIALGVGSINAALETAGASAIAKPIAQGVKATFKKQLTQIFKDRAVLEAAKRLALAYGGGVAAETGTEVAQEVVTIMGEELGKALSEGEFESITEEELETRLTEVAVQTFKGMALLALPGPGVNFAGDVRRAQVAKKNQAILQRVNGEAKSSKLVEIAPEKAAEHIGESLKAADIGEVYIPISALDEANRITAESNIDLFEELGVTGQVEDARLLNGDVRIDVKKFTEVIGQTELFDQVSKDIRIHPDDMTVREAEEFEAGGLQDLEQELAPKEIEKETEGKDAAQQDKEFRDEALATIEQQIEHHLGLRGMFVTAREAGLTNREYEQYLASLDRAADQTAVRAERRRLKVEQERNAKEQKEERAAVLDEVTESVNQRPLYAAFNAIGMERLDRKRVAELLPGGENMLSFLPTQDRNRKIYTNKSEIGIDPDEFAELYGFEDGQQMLLAMINQPKKETVIAREVQARLQESELVREGTKIEQALEATHHDKYSEVLAFELNQLRKGEGTGSVGPVKLSLVKQLAKERIAEFKLEDIKPHRFAAQMRKAGQEARRALREGDRKTAAQAKLQQLLNFEYSQQAWRVQNKLKKQQGYLNKFTRRRKLPKGIPVENMQAIKTLLSDRNVGPKISNDVRVDLQQFSNDKAIPIDAKLFTAPLGYDINQATLREFEELHNTVKLIEKLGRDENKLHREQQAGARDAAASRVIANVLKNLEVIDPVVETTWDAAKSYGREALLTTFNAGTMLRKIDGFEDLGSAHDALKRPYDQAMTEGYLDGHIGFLPWMKQESEKLNKLYEVWSKKERLNMRRRIEVPGVDRRMSHQRLLAVLLNTGNRDNLAAMVESGQFTEAEIAAIQDTATEKDWKFVQSVWDYLDTLWPQISDSIKRRQGIVPEKVEARPIETKYGTFKGGYYPLQFDTNEGILTVSKGVEDLVTQARFGQFTSGHTKNGHTKVRIGSGGRPVKLDLFVLNAHVNQVGYDLEVGDAVQDMYKVLYHKDVKKAFQATGQVQLWDKLDLWFGDIVVGEMHYSGLMEKTFRHLRTGFVLSKIGYNISTVLFQPLGLFNTAAQIGKYNTWRGLRDTLLAKQTGPNSVWKFVSSQSGFMRQREAAFNREIVEAQQALSSSIVERVTPGKSAELFAKGAFYGIIKLQRFVDVVTWMGAKRKGMELFNGDETRAIEYADNMVERAQATGIQGGRTQLERGTAGKRVRQSEIVRAFVPLISYFMAKTNVAYERTKKTNFRNPGQVIGWATDMALLYTAEALLVAIIRGEWPDEDESKLNFVAGETIQSLGAGVPFVRDFISEAEGFRGGGVFSATLGEAAKVWEQANQGEVDRALIKSSARLAGTVLRIPGAGQAIKTGETTAMSLDGDDVEFWEFIMGPHWDG